MGDPLGSPRVAPLFVFFYFDSSLTEDLRYRSSGARRIWAKMYANLIVNGPAKETRDFAMSWRDFSRIPSLNPSNLRFSALGKFPFPETSA